MPAITPSYNFPASSCPQPFAPGLQSLISLTGNPGTAVNARNIDQGDQAVGIVKFNVNALILDIMGAYGGGPGLLWGFNVSGSGLTLTVSSGQAFIAGMVEATVQSIVLPASSVTRIWLLNTGVLSSGSSSIIAPDSTSLYIGVATTAGTSITDFDQSGVVWNKGGSWRRTADVSLPTDTPTLPITTVGSGQSWFFDGSAHKPLVNSASLNFTSNGPVFSLHTYRSYLSVSASGVSGYQLTSSSPNIVYVTSLAPSSQITLPTTGMALGSWFEVYNNSYSTGSVLLMNGGSVVGMAVPSNYIKVTTVPGSSAGNNTPIWPTAVQPAVPF